MSNTYLVNGQPATTVPIADRGLAYGQGVFETILVAAGQPALINDHYDRLIQGCQRLNIPTANLLDALRRDISSLDLPTADSVLKVTITCGSGGRGYLTPEEVSLTRILSLSSVPAYPDNPQQGVSVHWCRTQLAVQPLLSGIKHLNRLEQVLARDEWRHTNCREGLVCDTRGFVIEGTMSNLFWVQDGVLYTPDLTGSGIEGVMRRQVLAQAAKWAIEVRIGSFTPEEVRAADELFLCNSLNGIWPIVQLGQEKFKLGELTARLQSLQLQRTVQ